MKPHPFVKFLTEEIVGAIDQRNHQQTKRKMNKPKENFWTKWFGMVPYSLKISWYHRKRLRRK